MAVRRAHCTGKFIGSEEAPPTVSTTGALPGATPLGTTTAVW